METTKTTAVKLTDLSAFDPVAMALEELRKRHEGVVHDVKTAAGMAACRKDRAEVKGYRMRVEEIRKKLKAPILEAGRAVDEKAATITTAITSLETAYDNQIKAEDQRKEMEKRKREEAEREEREAALRAEREKAEVEAAALRRQMEELQAQLAAAKAEQAEQAKPSDNIPLANEVPQGWATVGTSIEPDVAPQPRIAAHMPAAHDVDLLDLVEAKPVERAPTVVRPSRTRDQVPVQHVEPGGLPTAQEIVDALSENAKRYTNIRHVCAVLEAIRKIESRA
ncbi:TPA: hypothetical protein QDA99_006631 [Burkholderia vietnamiensis]|uniref:hypothetical protein n=1 Tax=Burkholderia vietnamiensis TaxID=60552 RepID=UPI00158AE1AE|nr:hypothetical protein [Burkholderia vietnamiensis]HDR9003007.1 hypothetical protein [Burkholderia vietnamiensis]HDR9006949.1 hypothetical protein [Burkholderia vietnamiensis]